LQYLTFECFDRDIGQDKLRQFALGGYFAFQDYAIAKWLHHFRAIVDAGQELFSEDSDTIAALEEINIALDDFANNYEDEILLEPVVDASREACKAFTNCNFYENLLSVWSHIYRHQEKGSEARNDVSIKALNDALTQNRKSIEGLTSPKTDLDSEQKRNLDSFYGEKRYKCPKLTCFFFHEGFKDANTRDAHINRHDRPFNCPFPDCSVAEFGFGSNRDLERHERHFHPEMYDLANTFAAANTAKTTKTPWKCDICGKKFTRNFHLKSHTLSHKGERPHKCSECGKAFTRANDCRRHEKIHTRHR
jgi:hypothetical protein